MTQQMNEFKKIDDNLETYYHRLGSNYDRNEDGHGIFLQYIVENELNDEDIPIGQELGEERSPDQSMYTDINNFPMPSQCLVFTKQAKQSFIFYILQYCWRNQEPPSDQYIQQTIIQKCVGLNDQCQTNGMILCNLCNKNKY